MVGVAAEEYDFSDLVHAIEELADEVEAQRRTLEAIKQRLDAEQDRPDPSTVDHRNEAVRDRLTPGESYHVRQLARLYRQETDVSKRETVKARVKDLTKSGDFQRVEARVWRYAPEEGNE